MDERHCQDAIHEDGGIMYNEEREEFGGSARKACEKCPTSIFYKL